MKRRWQLILAVLLTALFSTDDCSALEVTFLYWGDRHAHNRVEIGMVDSVEVQVGGAAVLAGLVDALRKDNPRTLVLVAGDEFTGTPVSNFTRGMSQIEILNTSGIDAFTPGNHEFDYGWQSLVDVMKKAKFPVLLANVSQQDLLSNIFPSDTVLVTGGVRVGVVGLIYERFTQSVIRDGILGVSTMNPAISAAKFITERRSTCDLLVALTHMGWEDDSTLAAQVDGLDIIIGGHDHRPIDPPRTVNNTLIVHGEPYGRTLGRLAVEVDTSLDQITRYRHELIEVRSGIVSSNQKVEKLVDKLESKYARKLDQRIGSLVTDWNVSSNGSCNLAQWMADAMLEQVRIDLNSAVSLSVINAGNVRRSLPRGPITERDIWEICPFDNPLVIFQISSEELLSIVNYLIDTPREFMTFSNLEVIADSVRIGRLTVGGSPVTPLEDYTVVTSGYVWQQLESYLGIAQGDRARFYLPEVDQRGLLIEAVKRQRVVSTPLDSRWLIN